MIIAIAGGTGSGKTTLSKKIQNVYKKKLNTVIISMDNYYKNSNIDTFVNYDHPNAFDMTLLYKDLSQYLVTKSVTVHAYDFITKERSIIQTVSGIDLLILEGLYPFYTTEIRKLCYKKIYLDVNEELRFQRRISRDLEERGISEEDNLFMMNSFVKKMHSTHVIKQKIMADKICTNTADALFYLDLL